MIELIGLKFDNVFLEDLLLKTFDKELIETNYWNDCYWGVCRGVGLNKLGIILMNERTKRQNVQKEKNNI
jgi:predicted NAD-dependent protein-ADP-ribosyltransferase YbiA (DUF1768 family)